MPYFFPDIDECKESLDKCDKNAKCNNTIGSYTCTCKLGWKGDGFKCEGKSDIRWRF